MYLRKHRIEDSRGKADSEVVIQWCSGERYTTLDIMSFPRELTEQWNVFKEEI